MKSVQRALRVLAAFADERPKWCVRDLCVRTGLQKSQVSKILSDFRASGLLTQDPATREYAVGLRAVALAGKYFGANALSREAPGLMRRLVEATGQTATLAVIEDLDIMYLVSVEGPLLVDHSWRVGTWIPFHATAAGKVLAAWLPEAAIDRLIAVKGLPRFTPLTICDPGQLRANFRHIRRRGVAITHSEGTPGLGAQAVPVLGEGQHVIGALGVVYPDHLVSAKKRQALTEALHDSARSLSQRMGARVYPYGGAKG